MDVRFGTKGPSLRFYEQQQIIIISFGYSFDIRY